VKAPNSPEWMTVADVAEMLQFSRNRIYGMIQRDELPVYEFPGGDYRIRRKEFEAWVEKCRRTSRTHTQPPPPHA
jgi:excisionase family DNA binding protein